MKLKDFNWALVTGASSGIGREFAIELAKRGINVVLVGRNKERLEETAYRCRQLSVETITYPIDLSNMQDVKKLIQDLDHLKIDLLVNNAGIGLYGEFTKLNLEEIEKMIELNVKALTSLSHCFARKMIQAKHGGIINIASTAAHLPIPYFNVYAATKSYVYSLSISLWAELRKYNVHVLCVSPGPTETLFFERSFKNQEFHRFGKLMNPNLVAVGALKAFEKDKAFYVPHIKNKLITQFVARLVPHRVIARLLAFS